MSVSHRNDAYETVHRQFAWQVPDKFNMAEVCCGRWARSPQHQNATAILAHQPDGKTPMAWTFAQLQAAANVLSQQLKTLGVKRGDRVAIVMPQRFETAVSYMAVLQMGAVAMPLSMLFGPDALAFRVEDSGAAVALCDEVSAPVLQALRKECPALTNILEVPSALRMAQSHASAKHDYKSVSTRADDPAILIYTSGTTGNPKGALIPHRALVGNLTGFVCSQNWFGFEPTRADFHGDLPTGSDAVFWSPADWAWTGGLMDALLPSLYFGRPIVAYQGRFSPEIAFEILHAHGITHSFLFPTALKAMMKAQAHPRKHFKLKLKGLMSAGEAVGDAVFAYCRDELGVVVNEMFGQTEINYVVGNCQVFWPSKPGSMGRGYPGHQVAVIDDQGQICKPGEAGEVAVNRFDRHGHLDPVFFLGYWKNPMATQAKYTGNWCRTGDVAIQDEEGYLWYQGRTDDMFKAAGYRIGPGEIENCLVKHPAVVNAAVVPKPDADRGALVKAYVVLSPDYVAQRASAPNVQKFEKTLIEDLQRHVRGLLAPYEYPKEIEFIDQLPMTTTGKVQRRFLRLQEEERARQC
ncbi:acyl-CoA synthetase [Limnohabitans sp. 103DPR2]|uniref:acyl-CoA synthetase n=1 Tax=Limnohabitans sp. 103DPR2 TaxID=1678129 RepID=UPI0006DC3EBE|nr:AMP-binding protein [Limnohabitans sp. 103DPR2]ALK92730.1 Acetyl-coenzyme A synthetase [Limnohabitans sp. 103DPR2]